MAKAKKRRAPLRRAKDEVQTIQMVQRYERLLDQSLQRLGSLVTRMTTYRTKLRQYRSRLKGYEEARCDALQQAEMEAGRPARSVNLDPANG